MKNLIYLLVGIISLCISTNLLAQNCQEGRAVDFLEGNEVKAAFKTGGDMFTDNFIASYTVPNDSFSTIYAGSLWMGGYDQGGNLKMAAQTYRSSGNDYWSGPIPVGGGNPDCANFDKIWSVDGLAVKNLINDYNDNGVIDNIIDSALLKWPGRGNPFFFGIYGFALPNQNLAPFRDINSDGIYNPMDGDYPIADKAYPNVIADDLLWLVFNDIGNLHTQTNGGKLGVEVQLTAYAFDCANSPLVSQSIFVRHEIINRSVLAIRDFRAGLWTDFDLGCGSDDFMGTIPSMNTVYAYNSDNMDESSCVFAAQLKGFESNPPVQAITLLNRPIKSSMYYINSGSSPQGDPSSAVGYYRLMGSTWVNGVPLTSGGNGYAPNNTNTTSFVFPDNPNDTSGWSMVTAGLGGMDVRSIITTDTNAFMPGRTFELVTAYSYHRDLDSSNLQNVNLMYQQIPTIQNYYNNGYTINNTCSNVLSIDGDLQNMEQTVQVFPNPTEATVNVVSSSDIVAIQLFNPLGQLVITEANINQTATTLDVQNLSAGLYLLQVKTTAGYTTQKIRVQ